MNPSIPTGDIRPLGDRAFLLGAESAAAARAQAASLPTAEWPVVSVALVCGFSSVLVEVQSPEVDVSAVEAALARPVDEGAIGPGRVGRTVTVPCAFDGPDLDDVAALAGCTSDDVVAQLTSASLHVAVMGFSPGFAYLEGLPETLRSIPRRSSPRPLVPAGSVALANGHAAVYPSASPGGWQLLGRTGFRFFTLDGPPYAALEPGDAVRFTRATRHQPVEPEAWVLPPWTPPPSARPVFEVMAPGLRAVLQDSGRAQVAAIGVPGAAPADPSSHALANRLVGNGDDAAAVEITAGGSRLRCLGPCHVAFVGAEPDLRLSGVVVPWGQVLPLSAGQTLEVGSLRRGMRTYLAVAGGLLGAGAFGSVASDELCGLGPGPLARGSVLFAGAWAPPLGDHLQPRDEATGPSRGPVELRVVPGPHAEHFVADVLERLAMAHFRLGPDSNWVGLRLHAADPSAPELLAPGAGGLDSHGVVTGSIQVPPGGEPVVLGPDHATLGGYPVAAVVAAADRGLLGQCGPGTEVRLVPITLGEARAAWRAARRSLDEAVQGHYPIETG